MLWVIGIPLAFVGTSWISNAPFQDLPTGTFLVISAIAIAVAYSIGVVVDRGADVLSEGLNNRIRNDIKVTKPTTANWSGIHYAVLHEGSAELVRVTEYIRSRMRIMRSLIVNAPLVGVVGVVWVVCQTDVRRSEYVVAHPRCGCGGGAGSRQCVPCVAVTDLRLVRPHGTGLRHCGGTSARRWLTSRAKTKA